MQIIGASLNARLTDYTVDHKPGEFKNYNIQQISSALAKKAGVEVVVQGNPQGADKPFPRFNVQIGETIFDAISRLARMRNLFMTDDGQGRLVLFRNTGTDSQVAELQEGRNIKSASGIFLNALPFKKIEILGSRTSGDSTWGSEACSVTGSAENPSGRGNGTCTVMSEMPGDQQDMQLRADHELAEMKGTQVNVQVITAGWHMDPGTLWIQLIGKSVSVHSPMLFTNDRMTLAIASVTHRQDARGGTDTVLELCLPGRLGGVDQIEAKKAA